MAPKFRIELEDGVAGPNANEASLARELFRLKMRVVLRIEANPGIELAGRDPGDDFRRAEAVELGRRRGTVADGVPSGNEKPGNESVSRAQAKVPDQSR